MASCMDSIINWRRSQYPYLYDITKDSEESHSELFCILNQIFEKGFMQVISEIRQILYEILTNVIFKEENSVHMYC